MKGKSVLGKGLSALIQEAESPGRGGEKDVLDIPIAEIGFNPRQPRKIFADDKLAELAASITQVGILQPVLVRRLRPGEQVRHESGLKAAAAAAGGAPEAATTAESAHVTPDFTPDIAPDESSITESLPISYCVVAGERRVRAATLAGKTAVPAIICSYEETEALKVALLENIQREDLGPMEEAQAFGDLMEEYGATQEELAEMLGKSRSGVANALRLMSLEEEIQEMLAAGTLTRGHAKALLGLPAGPARLRLARLCRSRGLAVREVERRVQASSQPARRRRRKSGRPAEAPEIKALRERSEELFGSPVAIERNPVSGAGQISIKFFSDNDLTRLLTMLGVDTDLS